MRTTTKTDGFGSVQRVRKLQPQVVQMANFYRIYQHMINSESLVALPAIYFDGAETHTTRTPTSIGEAFKINEEVRHTLFGEA